MTRLLRAAGSISAFTLLSRIFGLWRDRLMAQTLGAGWVQGTFLIAWTLPNLMRRLLGEGALSASLVPAYAKARREDPAAARELLAQITGAVVTLLTPLCLLVALASVLMPAEWLPAPDAGGVPAMRLLLALNAVLFVYALPVCLSAVFSGAMNTLGMFALPAAVPPRFQTSPCRPPAIDGDILPRYVGGEIAGEIRDRIRDILLARHST